MRIGNACEGYEGIVSLRMEGEVVDGALGWEGIGRKAGLGIMWLDGGRLEADQGGFLREEGEV